MAVGTELLLGDIVNTNGQYLAKQLAAVGISVFYQTIVGDNEKRLFDAYSLAFNRADLVIATGGLGPTKDDLTKETAAQFFQKKMVEDQYSMDQLYSFFATQQKTVTEGNKKQGYFPEGAIILKNDHGTAPGCIIEKEGKILILLPGPPKEMIPMFENYVLPYLSRFGQGVLKSKTLRLCGIGEGHMEEKIQDIINAQTNPTVAPYAKDMEVILRITAKASTEAKALSIIEPLEEKIRQRLGEFIYGEGEQTLEEVIAHMILSRNMTIATAESCTGGMIASKLINFPGISNVFKEGVITYSNEAKIRQLHVKLETLQQYGAVSQQTAAEMAEGIARQASADIGISVTGIAGPGGGTVEKPVGLIYAGLCIRGRVITKKFQFSGDRQKIRIRTTIYVLDWLRKELQKLPNV